MIGYHVRPPVGRVAGGAVGHDEGRHEGLAPDLRELELAQVLLRDEQFGELRLCAQRAAGRRGSDDARGRADDAHDLLRWLVLRHVSCRSGGERKVADPRVEGEEDDLGGGEVVAEHPRDLQAGHTRHRVVEEDQVGPKLKRLAPGLDAIGGLTDDLEVGIRVDERAETLADSEVVVGDKDPNHFYCSSPD